MTFHTKVFDIDGPDQRDQSYRIVDATDADILQEDLSDKDWGKFKTEFVNWDDDYIPGKFNNFY